MVRFTFVSGKEIEYDYDWQKLAPKLQLGGMRLFAPEPGILIPLNSNTISLIEDMGGYPDEETEPIKSPVVEETPKEPDTTKEKPEVKEEKVRDIEAEKQKILAEMKSKSECQHDDHNIYYQEIMSGPKNNRKAQKRYFPVCANCGVRERYVKADSLTDEQLLNAMLWNK